MKRWLTALLAVLSLGLSLCGCGRANGTQGLEYEAWNEGWTVVGYSGTNGRVVIPEEYDGLPVVAIADAAFEDSDVEQVVIGANVTEIGNRAFAGSARLNKVTFSGDRLYSIEALAFSGCTALTQLCIPESVSFVGACAFFRFRSDQRLSIEGSTGHWAAWWRDGCNARIEYS